MSGAIVPIDGKGTQEKYHENRKQNYQKRPNLQSNIQGRKQKQILFFCCRVFQRKIESVETCQKLQHEIRVDQADRRTRKDRLLISIRREKKKMNEQELRYAKTLASQIAQFGMKDRFMRAVENNEREVIDALLTAAAAIWEEKVNKMKNIYLTRPDFRKDLADLVLALEK